MSSDYLTILQLSEPVTLFRLESAFHASCLRYQRLTAAGPLQFYRQSLLADADRAYQALRRSAVPGPSRPLSLLARRVQQMQPTAITPLSSAQIEENFCREVLYRLEGDLIRFDNRRELLALAHHWNLPVYEANMLMAQIVQSIRQYRLYEPSPREKQVSQKPRIRRFSALWIATAIAAIADVAIIYWLK